MEKVRVRRTERMNGGEAIKFTKGGDGAESTTVEESGGWSCYGSDGEDVVRNK